MWVLLSIKSYILSLTHCNAPGNRALWQMGIQHRDISASNMMYKRINCKIRGYLIDFDMSSLVGHDSRNLDRTGTMPFMALELLGSVAQEQTPVLHVYAHDGEAVCWVVFWLCVQYNNGTRLRCSFQDWERVDATTCYMNKLYVIRQLRRYPFTDSNTLLQGPIRRLLAKFRIRHEIQDRKGQIEEQIFEELMGKEVPVPDIDGWMGECNKEIRAQISCIS